MVRFSSSRKELEYFNIEGSYGGNQDWFWDFMMKAGGCAAVTACDCCIYFDIYKGTNLYPYESSNLTKKDYIRFGMDMKPHLRPRWSGIDTLELYTNGFQEYLSCRSCDAFGMIPFHGTRKFQDAGKVLREQIDKGIPVPYLLLKHKNPAFRDYEWHWFLMTGYEMHEDKCMVKAVTYGSWEWIDFEELWNTGYQRRGGMILYTMK